MKKFITVLFAILLSGTVHAANSGLKTAGDVLQFAIPAYAAAMTIYEDDWQGTKQLAAAYGATIATTYALKYTISEERPDGSNNQSFPSGHTASAFSGATFIHRRYGWKRAVIPYLLSGVVGYSRVDAKAHYIHDVLAGAAIAGAFSYWLADYNVQVSPTSVRFSLQF